MMALLFILFSLAIGFALFRKYWACLATSLLTLILCALMFIYHANQALGINF
ncbi:MAG: DUF5993 family protein [Simkaniaceae bacterium]|nr:DUF5993 family protein [Simkaniaceae bacterium]